MKRTRLSMAVFSTLIALMPFPSAVAADANSDWAPVQDKSKTQQTADTGRVIDSYTAPANKEWGYTKWMGGTPANQGIDVPFYVVHPLKDRKNAPLYVVLHSAGHTGWTSITAGYARSPDGAYNDAGIYHAPEDAYGLYLSGDAWWGKDAPGKSGDPTDPDGPVEKRVLDTIAWVMAKYGIDPNRVYLAGMSMGGSGGLGIGMRHGDVFASMMVWVPAGTDHVARRMHFGGKAPDGVTIPDPPVIVDMSAPNDGWSKGQEVMIKGAAAGKYPLIMGWAPIGHTGGTKAYRDYLGPIWAFPWLDIRKDQAYPVFTNASTDQKPPWLFPEGDKQADATGQINGYFRWKNGQDTPKAFAMQLWLDQPTPSDPPVATNVLAMNPPKESVADITFRRLQQFKVPSGKAVAFELVRAGKTVLVGTIRPDAAGLLTIPRQTITTVPAEMRLKLK